MKSDDLPALYRSANDLSLSSQSSFYLALMSHLVLLVVAAALSLVTPKNWVIPAIQLIVLLVVLACSIYLFAKRPDRYWYSGRAVAESIKTIAWRYSVRAEPFNNADAIARSVFQQKLKAVVEQNRDVAKLLTKHLDELQITTAMTELRAQPIEERKRIYSEYRIKDQLTWYAKKAKSNRIASSRFFWLLIGVNCIAVIAAVLRIVCISSPHWPTDFLVAASVSLLSWMEAKRFSELGASYALAAHEIGIIREQATAPLSEKEFSDFIGDAENAFSREHTQWVARKDV